MKKADRKTPDIYLIDFGEQEKKTFNIKQMYCMSDVVDGMVLYFGFNDARNIAFTDIENMGKRMEEMIHACLPDPEQTLVVTDTDYEMIALDNMLWRLYLHDLLVYNET